MKGFDVLHLKSAVKSRNKFDLSFYHLTTMDFGEIVPLLSQELIPGDKFSVKGNFFSRMAPLVKPTFGKFKFETVSAFVPYYQIADDAEAWLAGKTTWEGQTPKNRSITLEAFYAFIRTRCCSNIATTVEAADFTLFDAGGNVLNLPFTDEGRYYVKILNALGYALPSNVDLRTNSTWNTTEKNRRISAYPLLAFFKLYNDYMSQSQRFNTSALTNFLHCVRHGIAVSGYLPSTGGFTSDGLYTLFSNLRLNYENDYFTSAWQNPNAALNVAGSEGLTDLSVPGIPSAAGTFDRVSATLVANQLSTSQAVGSNVARVSQRALDMLRDFENWVKRNNYSGSRDVQQIFSRFGIKTEDYRSNYAHVIKTESMPIQVGDVTSTADTADGMLGEYAGKGIMSGSDGFSYDSDDYGMLLVLGYYTVAPMNAYGFDRSVLRESPLDYYTPEFDGLGGEAISVGELYANPLAAQEGDTRLDSEVFGFTERYNSYRYGRDRITGDFRNYHPDNEMNTWHSGRNLNEIRKSGDMYAQSSSMNTLEQVGSQYNRIFSITDDSVDHFYMTCFFEVEAMRPMLNLNQVVGLGTGDTAVPRNGNVIS